jgi:hypothetical protein
MTTALETPNRSAEPSKALHVGLWIAQVLAGLAFTMAGAMKSTTPIEQLAAKMTWVLHFPAPMVRFIGISELLGGLGLILPSALRIQPKLTVLAALGLVILMVGAAGTHVVLGEAQMMMPSLVLGALAAFVAWGRSKKAPIAPRG